MSKFYAKAGFLILLLAFQSHVRASQCKQALSVALNRWKASQYSLDRAYEAKRGDPYRQEKIKRALDEVSKAPIQVMNVIRRAVELMNEGHEDVNSFLVFLKSRPSLAKNQLPPQIDSLSKNLNKKYGIFPHTNPDSFWFVEKEAEGKPTYRLIEFKDLEHFHEP